MVADTTGASELLDAMAAGTLQYAWLASEHLEALVSHPNPGVAKRALELLGE